MIVSWWEGNVLHSIDWPKCAVEGCDNGVCFSLNSKYCYPHTNFTGLGVGTSIKSKEPVQQPATHQAQNLQSETSGS